MTGLESALWMGLTFVGLLGSAMCSGMETGMYTVNRVRLSIRIGGRDRAGSGGVADVSALRLKRELDQPDRALVTLLIANTAFGGIAATGIGAILEGLEYSEPAMIAINALVLTPVLFVFCETLPKEVFRAEADKLVYRFIGFLTAARRIMTWTLVLPLVHAAVGAISRALRLGSDARVGTARERISALLKEGASHGVLSEAQSTLLDRALALRTARVGDEAVPWGRVYTVLDRWDRARVLEFMRVHTVSRFPVVNGSGRVVGIVGNLDVSLHGGSSVVGCSQPATFLEPGISVREGLLRMKERGAKLAIVGKPGERPIGIVTVKDLVEPLTGELAAW